MELSPPPPLSFTRVRMNLRYDESSPKRMIYTQPPPPIFRVAFLLPRASLPVWWGALFPQIWGYYWGRHGKTGFAARLDTRLNRMPCRLAARSPSGGAAGSLAPASFKHYFGFSCTCAAWLAYTVETGFGMQIRAFCFLLFVLFA